MFRLKRANKAATQATLLMFALSSGVALAAQDDGRFMIRMNVQGQSEVPQWNVINYLYNPWTNQGAPYSCSVWSPNVSTIDWEQEFQQSRQCSQNQVRMATPVLFNPVLQTTKQDEAFQEQRTITVSQYQPAIGKHDYIDGESTKGWSAWADVGDHYDCTTWTPDTDTVNLYDDFGQTRDCQQNQTRSRDVNHVWASGKETPKRVDTEDKTITEQEQRTTQGTKDYIYGERIGSWTSWADTGTPYSCTAWIPKPDTVNLVQSYTQTRDCQQDQDSERNIYDVWRSGKETLNRVEPREQTITVEQSRGAIGTKDYITGTRASSWSSWSNSGGEYSCSGWSPSNSTVRWGDSFTQSQSCSQNQTRSRTIYNVWKSGKKTTKTTESDSQTISVINNRTAEGRDDYIVNTSYGSWSGWSNSSGYYNCTSWSPSPSTVDYGQRYTQTRTCSVNQERSRNVYNEWASGNSTYSGKQNDTRSTSVGDARYNTGTKNVITDSQTSYSSWRTSGGASCGSYSPSTSTVNLGQSFTQSRTCYQDYTRTKTVKDVWTDGSTTTKSTSTESKTESYDQSRGATGTKDYVVTYDYKERYYTYGNWSCNSWSPSADKVYYTDTFVQTRSCTRTAYYRYDRYAQYKSGKLVLQASGVVSSTSTESNTESRQTQGTSRDVCLSDMPQYKKDQIGCGPSYLRP